MKSADIAPIVMFALKICPARSGPTLLLLLVFALSASLIYLVVASLALYTFFWAATKSSASWSQIAHVVMPLFVRYSIICTPMAIVIGAVHVWQLYKGARIAGFTISALACQEPIDRIRAFELNSSS